MFLSVLFFVISIFFISDGTKEIFTITFLKKRSRFNLCSLLKTKVYFVTSHLPVCLGPDVL